MCLVILDADSLVYRIGFGYEKEEAEALVLWQVDDTINRILSACSATSYEAFLTSNDRTNFRFQIAPNYKGNRHAPKPKWYEIIRGHFVQKHGATVVSGMEADDAVATRSTLARTNGEECIIVAIDKDFLQIPGRHYNFVKREFLDISPEEGWKNFYSQILTGDRVDNVQGIKGIGPKKAERILGGMERSVTLYRRVREIYQEAYGERGDIELQKTADLLYLRRTPTDRWTPPEGEDFELRKDTDLD